MSRIWGCSLLLVLLIPAVALGAEPGTVICDNPAVSPARVFQWSPFSSVAVEGVCMDSTHLFIGSVFTGNVVRFSLNGENPVVWSPAITGTDAPGTMAISPTTGDLYVNDVYDPAGAAEPYLYVFDPDGNGSPKSVLLTGPPSMAPGGIVDGPQRFAIHPVTGDLYVLDEGYYSEGNEVTWVSRIQRFDANGNYNGLVINNVLQAPPDPEELPVFTCGKWYAAAWLVVDKQGNIYLGDYGNLNGDIQVIHKFTSTGACASSSPTTLGLRMRDVDASGSTAG